MSALTRLAREALRAPLPLGAAAAVVVAQSLLQLRLTATVQPWIAGPILESADPRRLAAETLLLLAGLALCIFTGRAVLAQVTQGLVERLRQRAAVALLRATPAAGRTLQAGDVVARLLTDAGAVAGVPEVLIPRVLGDGVLMAGALLAMLRLDAPRSLAMCAPLLLVLVVVLLGGRRIRAASAAARREHGAMAALLRDQIRGLSTIRAFQGESAETARFGPRAARAAAAAVSADARAALFGAALLVSTGAALVIAAVVASDPARGGASPGAVVALGLFGAQVVEPLRRLGEAQATLQAALAAADRVFAVIDLAPREEAALGVAPPAGPGVVELAHVRFAYGSGANVLEDVRLRVAPGGALALVGESGSGKTTIARLLARLETAARGMVLLDGVDVREWRLADLRRAVAVVEQDPFVFAGSVLDNIRYGARHATAAEAERAARLAGLLPLLRERGGIEAPLCEASRDLSGGQRQRIALARAILREPRVLVLDEATSAWDGAAESDVLGHLSGWLLRRTVIVIAHRWTTIERCPQAALLHGGRIVAQGAPADLLARDPRFAAALGDQVPPAAVPRSA